jgi:hypothetical protein
LVKRDSKFAVYSLSERARGARIGYEVFIIHRERGRVYKGRRMHPYERFPFKCEYGRYTWFFSFEQTALKKLKILQNSLKKGSGDN